MNLLAYASSLLKHLNKDNVLTDVRSTQDTMKNFVQPTFRTASEFFRDNKLNSKKAQDLQNQFYQKFDRKGVPKSNNFISEIDKRVPDLIANIDWLEGQIEKIFERDILSDGLTARKSALIRSVEQLSFLAHFLPDVLNYIYIEESLHVGAEAGASVEKLSPAEEKKIHVGFPTMIDILSDFSVETKTLSATIVDIPDVNIGGTNAEMVSGLYPDHKLDPFRTGPVSGFSWSPIYHFRMVIAEWQNSQYKANVDKKKMLELRLLQLELLQEKKYDPKIEKEIEYTSNRVAKIERYLESVREDLEVEK